MALQSRLYSVVARRLGGSYYGSIVRPVSNVVLLSCYKAGSTVARLQRDTSTTWFQTSNLIHTMTVEWNGCFQKQNTKIKKRFSKLLNIF